MTEPAAGTARVRRTVRVAAALVAGQVLLGAVIGWVTFGESSPTPQAAGRIEPPAAPLPVVPPETSGPGPAVTVPPEPPVRPGASPSRVRSTKRPAGGPARPARTRTTAPAPQPPAEEPPPQLVISLPPSPTVLPSGGPGRGRRTPPPAPSPSVQGPVRVGDRCEPEGAAGRTADDRPVLCARGDDGELRWQIN